MKKVIILTDNTCDLNKETIKEKDIRVLTINAHVDGTDVSSITETEMFNLVNKTGVLPKTSSLNIHDFDVEFQKYKDEEVLYLGLGSGFSSTFSAAYNASLEYDNVYVVDSQNLSSGTGLLVLKACKFRDEGLSAKEIKEKIEELVPRVRTQFALDTFQYLHMGGRCSGMVSLIGSVLKIKPIIKLTNNALGVGKKPIGFTKALNVMIDEIIEKADAVDLDCIMVTHCLADEAAKYIKDKLYKKFNKEIIMETTASVVIASHCGPNTIGILYIMK